MSPRRQLFHPALPAPPPRRASLPSSVATGEAWLQSSCPVGHRRDYSLTRHAHFSGEEAEATMQGGIPFIHPGSPSLTRVHWKGSSG